MAEGQFTTNQGPRNTGAPVTPGSGAPAPAGSSTSDPSALESDGSNISGGDSSIFSSLTSGLGGIAPYLAAGGLGLYEGSQASKQNQAKENQLTALGTPLTNQGTALTGAYNTGTLTPAEQNVVTTAQQQGQTLIDAASPLYSIASSAFSQYQAGQLQPWQQTQLDQSTAAQKASIQSQFASMGLSGSTQEAAQLAQVDSNAEITKGTMMANNLQVGDQQFSQWLTTTTQGQQIQMAGKQFAVQALDTDLTTGLQFSQAGMEPVQQAVTLGIQQDTQLSGNIQQLMTGLMTAYARSTYNSGASGNGTAGGSGATGLVGSLAKMFGGGSSSSGVPITGGALDQQNNATDLAAANQSLQQNMTQFDTQLANQTVDPSWFNDPNSTSMPDLSFTDTGDTDWSNG